ncbi:MAG: N-acetyl-gamma-glutamyl-phosphate reductase [Clostridiales bacterium]|nr:N-acetyl-gamma-glutamyl-phosphate reductase [Clostridiales bacterium]
MATKVYIDGQEGTTGLKILERFEGRKDIEILRIDESKRKDLNERKRLINASDFTFLCLPDYAAIEAVSLVENKNVRIIDASTAHRTKNSWAYGFPELSSEHREKIKNSKRVAVPGCYASAFIALIYPLIKAGLLQPHYPVFAYATSGYSGAGRQMIEKYEDKNRPKEMDGPMQYALEQNHKHLPEMQIISGLAYKPMFNPMICDYYSGMTLSIPIQARLLHRLVDIQDFWNVYDKHYKNQNFVKVKKLAGEGELSGGFLPSNYLSGNNKMDIFVFGNSEQILLCACLDNLGKGASGAAVQCLNIMMGVEETTGLI